MKRVGAEIPSGDHWRAAGTAYAAEINQPYHRHRLRVIGALLPIVTGREALDFGCGDGVMLRELVGRGAAAIGIERDPALAERAATVGRVICGGVDALRDLGRQGCILAANVLAFMTTDEERAFYTEARRILAPAGHLVVTHSNDLFDLFTLNAFTADFHRRHFGSDVSGLLAQPNKPSRATFNVRENPISYPAKLAGLGFAVERMEFMNYHAAPPLISGEDGDDMTRERIDTLNWPEAERWKLMFQCSMFGVRARAI